MRYQKGSFRKLFTFKKRQRNKNVQHGVNYVVFARGTNGHEFCKQISFREINKSTSPSPVTPFHFMVSLHADEILVKFKLTINVAFQFNVNQ